jgi:mono/diheme cytochrome c family protein
MFSRIADGGREMPATGKDKEANMSRSRVIGRIAAVAVAGWLVGAGAAMAQTPWVAPATEKAKKNPVAKDAKAVEQGKKTAQVNCVSCHGAGGKGDGVAAAALNPKPADWTSAKIQGETDGELFWKISNGRGAMPPWKHLPENERWALVHYIRSLKK